MSHWPIGKFFSGICEQIDKSDQILLAYLELYIKKNLPTMDFKNLGSHRFQDMKK